MGILDEEVWESVMQLVKYLVEQKYWVRSCAVGSTTCSTSAVLTTVESYYMRHIF